MDRIPVPTWEGEYSVDSLGRVWTDTKRVMGRDGKYRTVFERPLKTYRARNGYLQVGLRNSERGRKTYEVHRVVAWAYLGERPGGMQVRHLDGDQLNNAPENLTYGTVSENNLDKIRHGTDHYASRDRCEWGHIYQDGTFRLDKETNGRYCIACNRANSIVRAHPEFRSRRQQVSNLYYAELVGKIPATGKSNRVEKIAAYLAQSA